MKYLLVYYSRSGKTQKIAELIRQEIQSDIEEIKDHKNRKGIIGFLRSGNEAYLRKMPLIDRLKKDLAQYDIIIIGTPIWANNIASPVRSFLEEYKDKLERVAFFSTSMGSDPKLILINMQKMINKNPIAVVNITSRDIKNQYHFEMVNQFVQRIKKLEKEKI